MTIKESDVSEDLLPCPFCGGPARTMPALTTVYCDTPNCGAAQRCDTQEYAIKMWNTRVSPPLPSPGVERLIVDALRQAVDVLSYVEAEGSDFDIAVSEAIADGKAALSALPLDGGGCASLSLTPSGIGEEGAA